MREGRKAVRECSPAKRSAATQSLGRGFAAGVRPHRALNLGYMLRKGLTPCLEFDCAERSFAKEQPAYGPGFYYNRYWMMWKLPMFGCTDGDQVLKEVANCKKDYPDHYIRVVGFNAEKQVQMASFIVHKPN